MAGRLWCCGESDERSRTGILRLSGSPLSRGRAAQTAAAHSRASGNPTLGRRRLKYEFLPRLLARKGTHTLARMFEARFQSFEDRSAGGESAPRLAALRAELKCRGLDGFIVPRADRYQNEYVPPCAERLAWLTGFTGSAGVAIVLAGRAAIFVDGRYMVQVREEVDSAAFTVEHLVEHPPSAWIEENLPADAKLGYSPWLHTVDGAERLAKAAAAAGGSL